MSPSIAGADAIVLKNGNRIDAERVWEKDGEYRCNQYGGVIGVPKGEVLRVERQQSNGESPGTQNKAFSADQAEANPEETIFSQAHKLYLELMNFKGESLFHEVGFASGNKYCDWMDRVGRLADDSRSKELLKRGIALQELANLGLEYFKSGGKETPFSRFANAEFRKAFHK
jgi:hypothetical protein